MRVGVGQIDDQTNHSLVVLNMVEERTTGVLSAGDFQRPASGVHDQTFFMLRRIDIPDFLDADTVMLGICF